MPTLFANPYSSDLRGFYFDSLDEYERKLTKSQQVFSSDYEHSIEFIDGDARDLNLYEALSGRDGISPGQVEDYFTLLDELDEPESAAFLAYINVSGLPKDSMADLAASIEAARDAYVGEMSLTDYAESLVDDEIMTNLDLYFDYDSFGRDLRMDHDDEDERMYEGMSDEDVGYEYVEDLGGVETLSKETISRYIDYDQLARDLSHDMTEISVDGSDHLFRDV